jgi:hypothetical protein
MCCSTPSPPQAGQAPNGLLKENSRGSISGMVKPDTGQANFSEKIRRLASDAAAVASLVFFSASGSAAGTPSRRASLVDLPLAGGGEESPAT